MICGAWIFGIIGSVLSVLLIVVIGAVVFVCKRAGAAKDKLLPQYAAPPRLQLPAVYLDPVLSGKTANPVDSRYRQTRRAQPQGAPATVFQAPPPGVAVRRGYH